jgi:thiosulfate/3-mercaptopyruvate sulfurtransferase
MYYVEAARLKDIQGLVLDCRFDMSQPTDGFKAYQAGHLSGAYYVDLEKDMTGPKGQHGGRHPLPDLDEFAKKMASLGVVTDSKVLIYDDGSLAMACRLWFMLKLIGLKDVYIVKGGYKALVEAGCSIDQVMPEKCENTLEINYQEHLICDIKAVKESLKQDKHVLVDARAEARYQGEEEPIDFVAGHIPGSVNYFWQETLVDNLDFKDHFKDLIAYDQVINQCGSGVTGCVNMFFMEEAGIKSKLYLGSYSDWISYQDNDIVIKNNKIVKVKQVSDEGKET